MKSLTQLCLAVLQGAIKGDDDPDAITVGCHSDYLVPESAIKDLKTEFMNRAGQFLWLYSFPGGGWNTVRAMTEEEAKTKAKSEWSYPNGEGLHSFRIIGSTEYDRIIRATNQN